MAFTKKALSFIFNIVGGATSFTPGTLGGGDPEHHTGVAPTPGANQVRIDGLRASVTITAGGTASLGGADISIYGMTTSNMNALSTLGLTADVIRKNVVTILAGEAGAQMSTAFIGVMIDCYGDYNSQPNVPFLIRSQAGGYEAVQAIQPTSIRGTADVPTMMADLAFQAGYNFVNSGVIATLSNCYYPGTLGDQIKAIASDARIDHTIERNTLFIWPRGQNRGTLIPVVSPDTGMVGYPSFSSNGLHIKTLYNPAFNIGQRIKVESSLAGASKEWDIKSVTHTLDASTPNGQWFSTFTSAPPGYVAAPSGRG